MAGEWTAAAGQFAATGTELGFDAARTVASAWRARCLPEATRSVVRAACALTCDDARPRLFDREPPWRTAEDFLAAAEEHEAEAVATAANAARMTAACENTRDRAISDYERAHRSLNTADTEAQAAAAREAMQAAAQAVGDCDAALDLLAQVNSRLGYAIDCFRRTPADFEDAYDVVLQHVRDGGTLPWSGDFITGTRR